MAGGPTVGLDIGSTQIKAVQVQRGGGGVAVTAIGVAPTPPGAVENGLIVDVQMLGQAIKNLLKQSGISSRQCVSSVSGQSVVVRVIEVPKMNPAELAETIKWEVERQVPFAASEVIMDYQAIDRPEGVPDGQNMEVLLAVAQQDMIDRHVEMLFAAGLKPSAIDVEPLATARCLLDLLPESRPGHTVAIVNIGATNTDIAIYRDRLLAFPRSLPLAGDNFTRAISDMLQVDLATAEKYKIEVGEILLDQMQQPAQNFGGGGFGADTGFIMDFNAPAPPGGAVPPTGPAHMTGFDFSSPNQAPLAPEPAGFDQSGNPVAPPAFDPNAPTAPAADTGFITPEPAPSAGSANLPVPSGGVPQDALRMQVFNAIAPVLVELVQELRRSLDYYRGRAADAQVDEVLLIGGSARLKNLAPYLEMELGVPTRVADPLRNVQITSKNFSQSHLEEMASLFPVSIGLGARDLIAAPAGTKKR